MESGKVVEFEEVGVGVKLKVLEEDNVLWDMIDVKNEDFIYVY